MSSEKKHRLLCFPFFFIVAQRPLRGPMGQHDLMPKTHQTRIHRLSQLTPHLLRQLPHTYKSISRLAWCKLKTVSTSQPKRYHMNAFWSRWRSCTAASTIAVVLMDIPPLHEPFWHSRRTLPLHEHHRRFFYELGWDKRYIGYRLRHGIPKDPHCPFDACIQNVSRQSTSKISKWCCHLPTVFN